MSEYSNELNQYFHFISETLGVKQLYVGAAAKGDQNGEAVVSKKWIYVENYSSYNQSEQDLLKKMIMALGLKPDDYELTDQSNLTELTFLISFVEKPQTKTQTYSPRVLMLKPELKKATREDMKRIVLTPS